MLLVVPIACVASGMVTGGDSKFDASSASFDASFDAASCEPLADAGAPPTWSGLYADYFGPTGRATCTFSPNGCHAAPGDPGASATGYVCAAGKDGCYLGITSANAKSESGNPLVVPGDADASFLPQIIRKPDDGSGQLRMPLLPNTVHFCPSDVDRVRTWIQNGAKND